MINKNPTKAKEYRPVLASYIEHLATEEDEESESESESDDSSDESETSDSETEEVEQLADSIEQMRVNSGKART